MEKTRREREREREREGRKRLKGVSFPDGENKKEADETRKRKILKFLLLKRYQKL